MRRRRASCKSAPLVSCAAPPPCPAPPLTHACAPCANPAAPGPGGGAPGAAAPRAGALRAPGCERRGGGRGARPVAAGAPSEGMAAPLGVGRCLLCRIPRSGARKLCCHPMRRGIPRGKGRTGPATTRRWEESPVPAGRLGSCFQWHDTSATSEQTPAGGARRVRRAGAAAAGGGISAGRGRGRACGALLAGRTAAGALAAGRLAPLQVPARPTPFPACARLRHSLTAAATTGSPLFTRQTHRIPAPQTP
jgi:hypothetical protein